MKNREPEITFRNIGKRVHDPSRPGVTLTSEEVEWILRDIEQIQIMTRNHPYADAIFLDLKDIFFVVTKSYEV